MGYDSPLIYERFVASLGAVFTKRHPYLYRDDCMIQNNLYFQNKQVLEIYNCLQEFRDSYQNKINLLVSKIRSRCLLENAESPYEKDIVWLKVLPYNLLNGLAQAREKYQQVYQEFISGNRISLRLKQYETLYLYPNKFSDYGL